MYKNVVKILSISKEKGVDLSVAYAMAYKEEMKKTDFSKEVLDRARNTIDRYYEKITKMWVNGNLDAIKTLCNLVEEGDMQAVNELLGEW